MQPLSPVRAEEASALTMENELLRYEVRHLRARLEGAEQELRRAERSDDDASSLATAPITEPGGERASEDLVWLLQRLNTSPLGFALRRQSGFRTLLQRHLGDPAS